MVILIILILLIHNSICFHLCQFSFVLAVSYSFQSTGLSPPWLNLFRHFILLMLLQMGLLFKFLYIIIVSVKKYNQFLYINLVSCNFTEMFIFSNSFLVVSLRFSIYSIMLSANSRVLCSPFQLGFLFIFFVSDYCG